MYDCAIIGGGPAGLNAALVLGRARRQVIFFDNNKPRNNVTEESHGFITRDGVKPQEFRDIAYQEISKYPSVEFKNNEVMTITKNDSCYVLMTDEEETFEAKRILLATGLKEIFPDINGISDYYGKTLFNCAYCEGWELKDKALIVVGVTQHLFHAVKIIYNWSKDIIVATNGANNLSNENKEALQNKGIQVVEKKITEFVGENGRLNQVVFEDGTTIERESGFIIPEFVQSCKFGEQLGCKLNDQGFIVVDNFGRTNIPGVYAAGDTIGLTSAQLVISASDGSRAAIGINIDLTIEEWK